MSAMSNLVPNRLLFEFEFPLHYRREVPAFDGALSKWGEELFVPALCELDGQEPFAPVYACWNETGLHVATRVAEKRTPLRCDPAAFWRGDNLRLCTDMRDARTSKRASRFCQQFYLLPTGGGRDGREPVGGSAKIQRAKEDAPAVPSSRIRTHSHVTRTRYTLQAHLPADALSGFDPSEHPRIGFYYILEDHDYGQQYLTVGDDLYWYVDPSTWATAVLTRD
jgi:hypothetical protein